MKMSDVRVLICDDSILVRKRLRELLERLGCTVAAEAADGQQAVALFARHRPEVVFMDIIMPKKTGLEALREIRAIAPDAKVVMASSVGTQSHLKEAVDVGVYDFLQKPIDEQQVQRILDHICEG